ncbi:Endoglucanase EG-II [Teratosphaeriaceae sp. CCFEE 6253]|nr:Endoglucanase EG-II [Teratosphaeriaceae sp. CCFEE 6253]
MCHRHAASTTEGRYPRTVRYRYLLLLHPGKIQSPPGASTRRHLALPRGLPDASADAINLKPIVTDASPPDLFRPPPVLPSPRMPVEIAEQLLDHSFKPFTPVGYSGATLPSYFFSDTIISPTRHLFTMKTAGALLTLAVAAGTAHAQAAAYAQCGGTGFTGSTTCVSGYYCSFSSQYYSQCVPGSASSAAATTAKATTTAAATTAKPVTTTAKATSAAPATTSAASSSGKVQYAGVNIAGFDFGCGTDGTCTVSGIVDPGTDGIAQIKHFVTDDGLNAFRLPVGWQYLVNNNLGGTLDATNFGKYDTLVQGCLSAGAALCIVDIHNYARWNGAIIGQGGPTNAQFASLWSQLATKYKGNTKVAFGIMNEPHDLDINTWATTVQAAVTAIRNAGATGNKILLPGTGYTSAAEFIDNGSAAALSKVTNLDGSTTNLIFDVHRYLDSDNSGTHASCTTNNVAAFTTLGNYLRTNKRQAILTETGGGPNDSSCLTALCQQFDTLNSYSDVFLGWTGWAAGKFDTSYVLSETPTLSGGVYTDQPLVKQCIVGKFK